MSVAHEFRQVYHSMMRELRNESLFGKFSLLSKDLEILSVPRIVGRMRSRGGGRGTPILDLTGCAAQQGVLLR